MFRHTEKSEVQTLASFDLRSALSTPLLVSSGHIALGGLSTGGTCAGSFTREVFPLMLKKSNIGDWMTSTLQP